MYVPAVTCYTAAHKMLSKFSVRCTCRCIVPRQSPKLGSLARSLARAWEAKRTALTWRRGVAAREMEGKEKKVLDWLLS